MYMFTFWRKKTTRLLFTSDNISISKIKLETANRIAIAIKHLPASITYCDLTCFKKKVIQCAEQRIKYTYVECDFFFLFSFFVLHIFHEHLSKYRKLSCSIRIDSVYK